MEQKTYQSVYLYGAPPNGAKKDVVIDPHLTVGAVKAILKKQFNIMPLLAINLVWNGKVLPDSMPWGQLRIPRSSTIGLITVVVGG